MIDYDAIRERWISERPAYADLAAHISARLKRELQRRGLMASHQSRGKAIDSLIKKALRKGYDYEQIRDKAGVRVIADFPGDIPTVEDMVRNLL